MKALITGGRGFVGLHLAAHLAAEGDDVVAIDIEVDVTDPAAVTDAVAAADPDVIYHLAALAHVGESWADPSKVLGVNVIGTANVLAAARQVAPRARTVAVSSAEVYGIVAPDELPLTEASEVRPASPYAASKAAAEQVAKTADGPLVLVTGRNTDLTGTASPSPRWPSGSSTQARQGRVGCPWGR